MIGRKLRSFGILMLLAHALTSPATPLFFTQVMCHFMLKNPRDYIVLWSLMLAAIFFSTNNNARAQQIEVVQFSELFAMMDSCGEDRLKVYNFWATWCKPCVAELPLFEQVHQQYADVSVTLVSLDDVDDLSTRVTSFLHSNNVRAPVVLLNETDFNDFISRVDDAWSGAVPATLVIDCRQGLRYFLEREFKGTDLIDVVEDILNKQ
jgi:thiol-disulfide isomerase/thioredoxin